MLIGASRPISACQDLEGLHLSGVRRTLLLGQLACAVDALSPKSLPPLIRSVVAFVSTSPRRLIVYRTSDDRGLRLVAQQQMDGISITPSSANKAAAAVGSWICAR